MERVYEERINWEDYPSTKTPVDEIHLNKMDYALHEIDKRVTDMHERLGGDVDALPIDKGGTGATTAKEAQYNLLKDMGQVTSAMDDNTLIAGVFINPTSANGAVHKRKASTIWNYISGKISSVLGLTATHYAGLSQLATKDAFGNVIADTYATKNEVAPINNLLATVPGSPLDAVQGKELSGLITALSEALTDAVTWKLLGSAKGTTPINLADISFKELYIEVMFDDEYYVYNIPFSALKTSPRPYSNGSAIYYSADTPTLYLVRIHASKTQVQLLEFAANIGSYTRNDYTSNSTTTVYYR